MGRRFFQPRGRQRPVQAAQWIGGQRLVLVKNPDYFIKGVPRLDAVVEEIGVNDDLQWLKFEAGEIDVSRIPPAEFPYVMKTPRLRALTLNIVDIATEYLGMNCQMKPFDDVRVRRAFNYAIDKRKIIALLNGRGVVAARRPAARSARLRSEPERLSLRSRQGAAAARGGGRGHRTFRQRSGCAPIRPR